VNELTPLTRRMTRTLMRCAIRLLPPTRLDWAKAMRAELDCFENDRNACFWAAGCVVAALKERMTAVFTGNLKIPRWLLILEMLLCFVPLTLGWLDGMLATSGIFGVFQLNGQIDFFTVHGGALALAPIVAGAVVGALGPLGLVAAYRLIILGHQTSTRWTRYVLIAAPLLYGVLILITRLVFGGTGASGFDSADNLHFWSAILFLSALPTLGAAHMLRMGQASRDGTPAS
jgi:hypothetical protein